MRILSAAYRACLDLLAPAEGEEWLIGLAVALLVLGAARHRLEPWLARVGTEAPAAIEAAADPGAAGPGVANPGVANPGAAGSGARADLAAAAAKTAPALPPGVAAAVRRVEPAAFGRVDLNRATVEELVTLPRIGPALAARIVADRTERGPFKTIGDLDRVKGIGPATLAALAADVVVSAEPQESRPSAMGESTRPGTAPTAAHSDSLSASASAE